MQRHYQFIAAALVSLSLTLSACGGSSATTGPTSPASQPSGQQPSAPTITRTQLGATLATFTANLGSPTDSTPINARYQAKISGNPVQVIITLYADEQQVLRVDDIRLDGPENVMTPQAGDAMCESFAPADKQGNKDVPGSDGIVIHEGMSASLATLFGTTLYQNFQSNGGATGSYYDEVVTIPNDAGVQYFSSCELGVGSPTP